MAKSASKRILDHFLSHVGEAISNNELRQLYEYDDVARLIRQYRQQGYQFERRRDGNARLLSAERLDTGAKRGAISGKLRYKLLNQAEHRCQSCGKSASEDGVRLEIDHKVPVDMGGSSDEGNLWAICSQCNNEKKAFYQDLPSLDISELILLPSASKRIEALFREHPDVDIPSELIRVVARISDWTRSLREIRSRTGMSIQSTKSKTHYRYFKRG
jgi:hypothetical protein